MTTLKQAGGKTLATKDALKAEIRAVVQESLTLAVDQTKTYNVSTTLGADVAKYNLLSIDIEVLILDQVPNSVTNGYYVDGSAVIAHGFKADGTVMIKNLYSESVQCLVRIKVTKKPTN